MKQNPVPNNVIIDWLADYTHFICDRFCFPHDQANGLLQQYLDLTARGIPQQAVTSLHEQPATCEQRASYPDPPSPHQEACFQEQPSNPHAETQYFQNHFPRDSAPLRPHLEANAGGEADHLFNTVALTTPIATPPGHTSPYDQQSDDIMTEDRDFSEAGAASQQQPHTLSQSSIGNISDYDPLWVQKNNLDPLLVQKFKSVMKFDTLFAQGVIKLGDVLTFRVSTTINGQSQETEAHLQVKVHSVLLDIRHAHSIRSQAHHEVQPGPVIIQISRSASRTLRGSNTPRPRPAGVQQS